MASNPPCGKPADDRTRSRFNPVEFQETSASTAPCEKNPAFLGHGRRDTPGLISPRHVARERA
jgi:hypothetical protein